MASKRVFNKRVLCIQSERRWVTSCTNACPFIDTMATLVDLFGLDVLRSGLRPMLQRHCFVAFRKMVRNPRLTGV